MTLFADDSTISVACKHKEQYTDDINKALASIILWLENNNLKINLSKTQIMHFSQRPKNITNINIMYDGKQLNNVSITKFLGLTIDQKMDWKAHIAELNKKISSSSYALYKLAPTTSTDALLTAYHGLAAAVLRYGIIFWGNSTDKIQAFKHQKRCIRSMFRLEPTDSCKPYFKQHKILTLPSMYIYELALFVRANPKIFPNLSVQAIRNRRDKNKLLNRPSKTQLFRNSVFGMGPVIYNKVPQEIRELNTNLFKKKLKDLLTARCYYRIDEFLQDKF